MTMGSQGLAGAGLLLVVLFSLGTKVAPARSGQMSGQQQGVPPSSNSGHTSVLDHPSADNGPDPGKDNMEMQRMRMASEDRHKHMVVDADKMLQLATELKVEMDKTTKNEMSLTVIKKAGEIEKLAHDMKERMKG